MDFKMIDYYFINNKDRFPAEKIPLIKQKIHEIDVRTGRTMTDADIITVMDAVQTKTPTNMLLISIFLGGWGVDRFMMDEAGMGVLKLLTGGVCGVLWLVDVIQISGKVREDNFNKLMAALSTL